MRYTMGSDQDTEQKIIFTLHKKKLLTYNKEICMCFKDLDNAFDKLLKTTFIESSRKPRNG